MSDKVLFELRVQSDDDGHTRLEIYASPEWEAYHRSRQAERRGCCWPFDWLAGDEPDPVSRPRRAAGSTAEDLRRVLDSLQTIYDDLYGDALA